MAFLDEKGLAAVWKKITAKLSKKSSKEHKHEYTPEGDISIPTISVSSDKITIQEISDVGTLPEYSPASYTAPSYIEPTLNHSYNEEEQTVTLQYINGFFNILDSLVSLLLELLTNLVCMVTMLLRVSSSIPNYFTWLPENIVALISVGITVVVLYKVLGREG